MGKVAEIDHAFAWKEIADRMRNGKSANTAIKYTYRMFIWGSHITRQYSLSGGL
jgi:hypothetical protein